MNFIKPLNNKLTSVGNKLQDLALLILRLILAYGFFEPAMMKWKDINAVGDWFDSLGYPFPHLNAYMAGITELMGVILLVLGFGTRLISLLLIFVMFVAITTVHLKNGFQAGNNGFEIPLYYAVMLFVLFAFGPGKYSLESLFCKKDK
jgi:putative oxidoreductase